jgi:hypothetical protein
LLETPGFTHTVPMVGIDGASFTNAPNSAMIFAPLCADVAIGSRKVPGGEIHRHGRLAEMVERFGQ